MIRKNNTHELIQWSDHLLALRNNFTRGGKKHQLVFLDLERKYICDEINYYVLTILKFQFNTHDYITLSSNRFVISFQVKGKHLNQVYFLRLTAL